MTYQEITKYSSPNYTPAASVQGVFGQPRKVKSITIHHWGALGQSFLGVTNYLCRKGGNTSAHYVVAGSQVACIVDPDDAAWHAGNAVGNATSVGLELRPEADAETFESAAQLIADLRRCYGESLPLVPHRNWTSTSCPGVWDLARLDRRARELTAGNPVRVAAASVPKPAKKAPVAKKQYVTLPKSAQAWGIYRLGVAPQARNIFAYLAPAKFGGLTYEVLSWTVANQVAVIQTAQYGRVQVYVAKGTGATITTK